MFLKFTDKLEVMSVLQPSSLTLSLGRYKILLNVISGEPGTVPSEVLFLVIVQADCGCMILYPSPLKELDFVKDLTYLLITTVTFISVIEHCAMGINFFGLPRSKACYMICMTCVTFYEFFSL